MIRERFDALVCDLDGVVYRGDEAVPGAVEAVEALRAGGVRIVFCTNNSRYTIEQYQTKLARFGLSLTDDDLVTSAVVTAEVLGARGYAGRHALVVGGDGILQALRNAGVYVVDGDAPDLDATDVAVVVVGWDPRFDYDAMRRATFAVCSGATFVATNDDAAFPAAAGLWPGAGAILASIQTASGRRAEVMGKPHPPMLDAVARRLGDAQRIAIVGDRPETDLAGGAARGWTTILVLSGVTSRGDLDRVHPKPDLIIESLAELAASAGSQ